MPSFSKLVGMAKESFQEQMGNDRAQEGEERIDKRAADIQKRGRDMLGTDGVFNSVEDVLIVGLQPHLTNEEHDDKVNKALNALHNKMIDTEFVVKGEGKAAEWPQVGNRLVVLTDQRLMLLDRGKVFTSKDVVYEIPVQELEGFSSNRGMKGDKLTIHYKDGSSVEIPCHDTVVEGFQYRFLRIIGR